MNISNKGKPVNNTKNQILIHFADDNWILDFRKVLIHPQSNSLIISDLHFGLYATIRASGGYLPFYDSQIIQTQIHNLIQEYSSFHWILAGDIKHNHNTWNKLSKDEKSKIGEGLKLLTQVEKVTIILGNHDEGFGTILEKLNLPFSCLNQYQLNNVTIQHEYSLESLNKNFVISGHVHPVFRPTKLGYSIPVFLISQSHLLLPAFSPITGGYKINHVQPNKYNQWQCYGLLPNSIMDLGPLTAWQLN